MSTSSSTEGGDEKKRVVRIARHGTLLARSSDFTRASAILHTNDVEVGIDGKYDQGGVAHGETTAGVGVVSAAFRLDRLFQKDLDSGKKSPNIPPPPPPPPPPPHILQAPPAQDPQAGTRTTKQPSLAESESSDVSAKAESIKTTMAAPPPPPPVVTAPPMEQMFMRKPTRHRKLIKTRLSDLPSNIQEQVPQIRGGVAVYKVTDEVQRETHGTMVEINAIDYVEKLRQEISNLERKVSLLQGRLEQQAPPPTKQNLRSSLRMSTFMNKRSKDSDSRSQNSKGNAGRMGTFVKKTPQSQTIHRSGARGSLPPRQENQGLPRTDLPSSIPRAGTQKNPSPKISFPNGFGYQAPPSGPGARTFVSTSRQPSNHDDVNTVTSAQMKFNIPTSYAGAAARNRMQGTSSGASSLTHDDRQDSGASAPLPSQRRSESSADEPPVRQLSEPPDTGRDSSKGHMELRKNNTSESAYNVQGDRNAAPMPGVDAHRRSNKAGVVGRTRSFNIQADKLSKNSGVLEEHEKASRTYSLHRESDATPPKKTESKPQKKSRVRRLLGFR